MSEKKNKQEAEQQRLREMALDYKKRMMPLVKFLKKEGLQFRYARVGQSRIEYFRIGEYNKLRDKALESKEIKQDIKQLFGEVRNDFIYFRRIQGMKELKYPQILEPVTHTDVNAKFCSFKFDTTISNKGMFIGIVVGILALVLFPVWPYTLKYAIWLISLYLLIFLIGLLVFRLVIYIFCVIFGFNVWIFPNLLGDYGVIDSFKPIYYAQRWESSTFNIIIRITAFLMLVYGAYAIAIDPELLQRNLQTTKETINDVHDWGVSKIKNQPKFADRALPNLQTILNETSTEEIEKEEEEVVENEQNFDKL